MTGVDRTEYQDGNARNFSFALDYLVADDSARAFVLPGWSNGAIGGNLFRWNPTQLRVTSGFVHASDRRLSFIKPADARRRSAVGEQCAQPAVAERQRVRAPPDRRH